MGVDSPLFIFALVDEGYLLFLVVYFVSLMNLIIILKTALEFNRNTVHYNAT